MTPVTFRDAIMILDVRDLDTAANLRLKVPGRPLGREVASLVCGPVAA